MSKKRNSKPTIAVAMATELIVSGTPQGDEALLADLLNTVGVVEPAAEPVAVADDEIIEPADASTDIDAAVDAAAAALDSQEFYEQQDGGTPQNQPEADKPTVEVVKGKKRKAKADAAPKVAKVKTPKEPKPPAPPRVTFHGNRKSVVLDNRVGGRTADFLVLEASDALLSADELTAKQTALKDELDTKIAKKVAEKCIMLFKDLAAKRPVSNEVMVRAFKVLARDGFLTSGDKGNMQAALNDKYSIGTSRSQANQMFALFPFLKITVKDGKGRMVANSNSNVLSAVCSLHNLTVAEVATA